MDAILESLEKHKGIHTNKIQKYCHYYNNEKACPYERFGCKFLHEQSERCYFEGKCKNKLCQFKYIEIVEDIPDTEETTENNLNEKFLKLSESEQVETKDVFCDLYCNRGFYCHICSEENFEEFIGCNVLNVTEDFDDSDEDESDLITYYPCDKCDERFKNVEDLKTHFANNHKADKVLK